MAKSPAALIVDSSGNAVGVVLDGAVYRLQTLGKVEGRADKGGAPAGFPVWIGGWDGTNIRAVLTDVQGRVIIAPAGSKATLAGFCNGLVTLASTTPAVVRETTYTEQTTNARRSIASANAADTAAGTGARTVKITYYDQTLAGPKTETVTLNGTSYVNTVASDICFIEKIEVETVGSGGTNAGILTLKAATAGGGTTIWTVAVAAGTTNGAHHYVPAGQKCMITGFYGSIKGADSSRFYLKASNPLVAGSMDKVISDTVRVATNSSFLRTYGTAIVVLGPARIVSWVAPDSTSSRIYYASFDFYEEAA